MRHVAQQLLLCAHPSLELFGHAIEIPRQGVGFVAAALTHLQVDRLGVELLRLCFEGREPERQRRGLVGVSDDHAALVHTHRQRMLQQHLVTHAVAVTEIEQAGTDQGLQALVEKPSSGPEAKNWQKGGYIKKVPSDPWQNEYQYISPGEEGDFDLYSLGADGRPGGADSNADIGNWDLD